MCTVGFHSRSRDEWVANVRMQDDVQRVLRLERIGILR